jgi:hypothetical protein
MAMMCQKASCQAKSGLCIHEKMMVGVLLLVAIVLIVKLV